MNGLLSVARFIDRMNTLIGKGAFWLVLVAVLVGSVNAVVRKVFSISSNAFLEAQWYLFAAVFLLCAPYALLKNQHVRIDLISNRLAPRARAWVELFGTFFFLMPICVIVVKLSWTVFVTALLSHEMSPSEGGLPLWPARMLVPLGFGMLFLQGISQAVKCIGFLKGDCVDPLEREVKPSAEEELAESIRQQREAAAKQEQAK